MIQFLKFLDNITSSIGDQITFALMPKRFYMKKVKKTGRHSKILKHRSIN